jgi:hypothetical protein
MLLPNTRDSVGADRWHARLHGKIMTCMQALMLTVVNVPEPLTAA